MKKIVFIGLLILGFAMNVVAQTPKYVFYFIGDGMGINHVHGTEMYRGELQNIIGINSLQFSQFPYFTMATNYSASDGVTDSAAAGTALATGNKTKNGTVGMLANQQTDATSVAVRAKNVGAKVGIATSVAIDDATPSAFYAHTPSRKDYYKIGLQMIDSRFDFFAGSGFHQPEKKGAKDLFTLVQEGGYALLKGYNEYLQCSKGTDRVVLFQPEGAESGYSLPYAIDRKPGDLTLKEITLAGIDFLSKDAPKGFFFMVEGGKIDWCSHSNDAASTFREVMDFDEAIKVAYDFYKQHPDETLIVVTADHETGGLILGNGKYELNLKALKNQKISESGFTKVINGLRKEHKNKVSWEMVRNALKENFGFWNEVSLTAEQEARLQKVYDETFGNQKVELKESLYERDEPIASAAKDILNEIAMVSWASGAHSGACIPVYAIGAGAEKFHGKIDNTMIPVIITEIAGY